MGIRCFLGGDGEFCEPNCQSDFVGCEGIDFLACLLTDGGGQQYCNTIGWLDEGLLRVSQVKSRELDSCCWERDSWGVKFEGKIAMIYSLYEEGCSFSLAIDDFEMALLDWRNFLKNQCGQDF